MRKLAKSKTKKKAKKRVRHAQASQPMPLPTQRIERLQRLASAYSDASEREKTAHEQKKTASGELLEILRALDDAKKVEAGSVRVTQVKTERTTLDEMLLLKAGVSAQTIADCKVKSAPSYSVRVSELTTPRKGDALIVSVREHELTK